MSGVGHILTQSSPPVRLQAQAVNVTLLLRREPSGLSPVSAEASDTVLYLKLDGIWGQPGGSNYDVYFMDTAQNGLRCDLGVVSFYGIRPQSEQQSEGLSVTLKVNARQKDRLVAHLIRTQTLPLVFVPQDSEVKPSVVDIENVALCIARK